MVLLLLYIPWMTPKHGWHCKCKTKTFTLMNHIQYSISDTMFSKTTSNLTELYLKDKSPLQRSQGHSNNLLVSCLPTTSQIPTQYLYQHHPTLTILLLRWSNVWRSLRVELITWYSGLWYSAYWHKEYWTSFLSLYIEVSKLWVTLMLTVSFNGIVLVKSLSTLGG